MSTKFFCGWDGRMLYKSTRDFDVGEQVHAQDLVAGFGMPEPQDGTKVVCPTCAAADPPRETFVLADSPKLPRPIAMFSDR